MNRKTDTSRVDLVRLFSERDKLSSQISDIDRQIRAELGISSPDEAFKPRRKTISNDQFKALCGVV